jgi:hypothetical protein
MLAAGATALLCAIAAWTTTSASSDEAGVRHIRSISMCDYSLEMYGSRPAREFERYETTRFPSGSIGLASPGDCSAAVCVQYDTRLRLDRIPASLQASLGVGAAADVTFVRLDHGAYRDGVRFENGKEISLQQLHTGVSVVVTSLLERPIVTKREAAVV